MTEATIIGAACDGTTDDTTTMSGAEFQRHAGTDAQKWAEAFVAVCNREGWQRWDDADRIDFLLRWLRDYAEVRVAEEVGRVTARLVPRHDD